MPADALPGPPARREGVEIGRVLPRRPALEGHERSSPGPRGRLGERGVEHGAAAVRRQEGAEPARLARPDDGAAGVEGRGLIGHRPEVHQPTERPTLALRGEHAEALRVAAHLVGPARRLRAPPQARVVHGVGALLHPVGPTAHRPAHRCRRPTPLGTARPRAGRRRSPRGRRRALAATPPVGRVAGGHVVGKVAAQAVGAVEGAVAGLADRAREAAERRSRRSAGPPCTPRSSSHGVPAPRAGQHARGFGQGLVALEALAAVGVGAAGVALGAGLRVAARPRLLLRAAPGAVALPAAGRPDRPRRLAARRPGSPAARQPVRAVVAARAGVHRAGARLDADALVEGGVAVQRRQAQIVVVARRADLAHVARLAAGRVQPAVAQEAAPTVAVARAGLAPRAPPTFGGLKAVASADRCGRVTRRRRARRGPPLDAGRITGAGQAGQAAAVPAVAGGAASSRAAQRGGSSACRSRRRPRTPARPRSNT